MWCNSFDDFLFISNLDFFLDFAFRLNENHPFVLSREKKRPTPLTRSTKFIVCLTHWLLHLESPSLYASNGPTLILRYCLPSLQSYMTFQISDVTSIFDLG